MNTNLHMVENSMTHYTFLLIPIELDRMPHLLHAVVFYSFHR